MLSQKNVMALDWFSGGSDTLVTINDKKFTEDDFRHWWKDWQEKGMSFPDSPEKFIEWHLLAQQAKAMEMDKQPTFARKVYVFLQVRALMQLKKDEVDSQVDIKDDAVRKHYEENYTPIKVLQILTFDDKSKAEKVFEDMQQYNGNDAGKIVFADYNGVAPEEGGPTRYEEASVRPKDLADKDRWQKAFVDVKAAHVGEPFELETGWVLVRIHEIINPGDEDFAKFESSIRNQFRKEQEAQFTLELVESLKKKYNVAIVRDVLDKIEPEAEYSEEFLDTTVIHFGEQDIPVRYLLQNIAKEKGFRNQYGFSKEEYETVKMRVINGMLTQTLINMESMNRHYEKDEPLKWTYEFYRQGRMIKELEGQFREQAKPDEEALRKYYDEHIDDYTMPEVVSYALVDDDKQLVNKIWAGIMQGGDFYDLYKKYYTKDAPIKHGAIEELNDLLRAEIDKLVKGEVSPPFEYNNHFAIVKLVNKIDSKSLPFSEVKPKIAEKLQKEKFEALRSEYLETLRSKSDIRIDKDVWQDLKQEYGDKG